MLVQMHSSQPNGQREVKKEKTLEFADKYTGEGGGGAAQSGRINTKTGIAL